MSWTVFTHVSRSPYFRRSFWFRVARIGNLLALKALRVPFASCARAGLQTLLQTYIKAAFAVEMMESFPCSVCMKYCCFSAIFNQIAAIL